MRSPGNSRASGGPAGLALAYSYDGVLLTGETWSGPLVGTVGRTFDNALQTATRSVNGIPVTLQYDADGLLTQAGALTLARDAQTGLYRVPRSETSRTPEATAPSASCPSPPPRTVHRRSSPSSTPGMAWGGSSSRSRGPMAPPTPTPITTTPAAAWTRPARFRARRPTPTPTTPMAIV